MAFHPSTELLQVLYTRGSLQNLPHCDGVTFTIKNRLTPVRLTSIAKVQIGDYILAQEAVRVELASGEQRLVADIQDDKDLELPMGSSLRFLLAMPILIPGEFAIQIWFTTDILGPLHVQVQDSISQSEPIKPLIPRSLTDDYTVAAINARQEFIEMFAQKKFTHIKHYSFNANQLRGNCEHFTGVAQVPIGIAGPLIVNGEHANGSFLIPLATTEGTLVASYNRGIQLLNACGGVTSTIVGDSMQRAPVFEFSTARSARDFSHWVNVNEESIRQHAESTSQVAKLKYIDSYLSNKFVFLRFNFNTGDAAGQNMVSRATLAACTWMLESYKDSTVEHFYLESNLATDKKSSQINTLNGRGKQVIAECIVDRAVLAQRMRVTPEQLVHHGHVGNVGSFIAGANNNGLHSANGITALFIATGQDVANVSESSSGIIYSEVMSNGSLYLSITIPSLIVATHGGGTGLATQNECLQLMDCQGPGTVLKFAEIVAGVVLAGEISLAAAISSSDWVGSHERLGRNR